MRGSRINLVTEEKDATIELVNDDLKNLAKTLRRISFR